MLIEYFSERLARLFGLSSDEMKAERIQELIKKRSGNLEHLDQGRLGGHISSAFLTHIDEREFIAIQADVDRFVERIHRRKKRGGKLRRTEARAI